MQIFTFSPLTGVVLPPSGSDAPGAEVQVHPGREAPSINLVRSLPYEPDSVYLVDTLQPKAISETPSGYITAWPKIFAPREVMQLAWYLTLAEFTIFDQWMKDATFNSGPVFKWQDPDSTVERVWSFVIEDRTAFTVSEDADGRFAVSARAVELVFLG